MRSYEYWKQEVVEELENSWFINGNLKEGVYKIFGEVADLRRELSIVKNNLDKEAKASSNFAELKVRYDELQKRLITQEDTKALDDTIDSLNHKLNLLDGEVNGYRNERKSLVNQVENLTGQLESANNMNKNHLKNLKVKDEVLQNLDRENASLAEQVVKLKNGENEEYRKVVEHKNKLEQELILADKNAKNIEYAEQQTREALAELAKFRTIVDNVTIAAKKFVDELSQEKKLAEDANNNEDTHY